jgi:hypothetical protein
MPRSVALVFAASLAALTCDDGRPEVPLADEFAKAFCAHQLACCSPYELSLVTSDRYKTEDQCLPFATLAAQQQLGAIQGAIVQGRISVDPAKLAACVAAYRDGACNTSLQAPLTPSAVPDLGVALTACPDLFVGHVPNGQACNLPQECAPGSRCAGGPSKPIYGYYPGLPAPVALTPSPGLCVAYQKDGEPCNDSSDCGPSHSCRTPEFVCGPPTPEGQPCAATVSPLTGQVTSNCDASAGLFCDQVFTFTCRHFPRAGEPCNQQGAPQCDPDPAQALSCDFFSGICKPPGKEGDACGGPAIPPCREDLACQAAQRDGIGTCGGVPMLREACTDRCASPAVCTSGVCANPGTTPIGQPCNRDDECSSLSCTGFLSGRFVCAANGIMPRCVGAAVTAGNVTGFGGNTGGGGFGGTFITGIAGAGGRGMTGTGGASGSPALGCQFSNPPPQGPVIADFTGADGTMVLPIGGTFTYASPTGSGPMATITDGALHVTATTTGITTAQYWGVGIYFNGNTLPTDCINASGFVGVQFDIAGVVSGNGCSVQYSTNDSAHMDAMIDPKGSGPLGAYAPQATLTIPPTTTTMMMPFTGPSAPSGGSPSIAIDPFRLVGVQWQFTTAPGVENSCVVDLTIDNVRFF